MCQFYNKAMNMGKKLAGTPVEQSFPVEMVQTRPPSTVKQGHCLVCDRPLSQQEMFPPGRAPRYMCRPCYENLAYNTDRNTCLWCGQLLPQHKIQQRIANPRELRHAFCDGNCFDYHVVQAGLVLGVPFNVTGSMPKQLMPPNQSNGWGYDGYIRQLANNSDQGFNRRMIGQAANQSTLVGGKAVKYLP